MSIFTRKSYLFINRRFKQAVFFIIFTAFFANSALALTPNDPFLSYQWYLDKIGAMQAWDNAASAREVVVAVLDTGVDISHPDLKQNIWRNGGEVPADGTDNDGNGYIDDVNGWNFVENNNDVKPSVAPPYSLAGLAHGTLIAGIIAAVSNNNEGVAGIAWQTKIMPLRVLDSEGDGASDDVVRAIDYAVRARAQVINLSFTTLDYIPALIDAVRRARDAGVIIVAAAGNDSGLDMDYQPVYPVCADGPAGENWVIGVASVDSLDRRSSFSNYGSVCVDISAPGEKIFGTQFTNAAVPEFGLYGNRWNGTSLATPMVTGTVALIKAVASNLSRAQIIDILRQTAFPIDGINSAYRGRLGWGRLDAAAAVRRALELQASAPRSRFVVASDSGAPRVWLFDENGTLISAFLAYGEMFTGGVRIAVGDVDGDGAKEIITGAGPGGGPHVRIFNEAGQVESQFFAFNSQFRGGVTIAAGDVDNDGRDEIVVGSGRGASPIVKVFDNTGILENQFLVYSASFTGGIEVAVGDIDGDGAKEIITGAGPGGGPHVRAFERSGRLKGQFFAFENSYRGGLRLGVGDVDADRRADIIATRGSQTSSEVRIFSITGNQKNSFSAFVPALRTVLAPSAFDRDLDGKAEIFVASNSGGAELRGFSQIGALMLSFQLPTELRGNLRLATF